MSNSFNFDEALKDLQAGKDLTGKDGILMPLIKQLTEAAITAELDHHLANSDDPNRKNGKGSKTIKTGSGSFELNAVKAAPFKITKLLTDNGKEFTDRFIVNGEREPTGNHLFDKECTAQNIEHRLIKPKHPQTNGMVERFNGRISSILKTTRFNSADHLNETLINYMKVYNHSIPQKALGHITPIAALKKWQKKAPHLFKKKVYKLAEPDTYDFFIC